MTKILDITNQTFGNWTAIDFSHKEKNVSFWNCRCELCGDIHKVRIGNLRSGASKQCSNCGKSKHKDLTGKRFNNWYVKKYIGHSKYICVCNCGHEETVHGQHLKRNHSTQCIKCKYTKHSKTALDKVNLIGQKFNRLTVIELKNIKEFKNSKEKVWICLCECGNKKEVRTSYLRSGHTKSCGCLQTESRKNSFNGGKYISGGEIAGIIHGAKSRNIECANRDLLISLIEKQFEKQNFKCNLSGVDINFNIRGNNDKLIINSATASVDRIDSNMGYIDGNIQIVHKNINMMKWKLSNDEFKTWCNLVVENGK